MRFFSLTLLPLTFLANAQSLTKRDASTVRSDIQAIGSGAATLQSQVENYQGGANGALQIYQTAQQVDQAVQKATSDVISSSSFTEAESATLADAVTRLQPNVFGSLNALVAKKQLLLSAVPGADIAMLVRNALVQQKSDTDAFGGNLTSKLAPDLMRLAPLVTGNIDFHFNRAIEAFASNSTSNSTSS